jgi:hypothetical protein
LFTNSLSVSPCKDVGRKVERSSARPTQAQSLLSKIQTKIDRTEILELGEVMPGNQSRCHNPAINPPRPKLQRSNIEQNLGA